MRVAIIVDGLSAGGAERQAVLTAAQLLGRGHWAEVIACSAGNEYAELCAELGVPVVHLSRRGPLRAARLLDLTRHLRRERVEVVHAFKGSPSTYGRLAARLAGVPCIFGGYRALIRPSWSFRIANRVLTWGTAGWIANSEPVKRTIVADYRVPPARVHVVPNAVHLPTCESALARDAARTVHAIPAGVAGVAVIANLRREKNHALLLRAARRLIDEGVGARFLLAGEGPERAGLEALAARMSLGEHVRFLGHCRAIGDLLRACDLVVLTTDAEGLPNALLEAGAAGLPCVSTDNGGAGEIVIDGETGFLVPAGDEAALAARIRELIADPEQRRKMGAAGRARVLECFSPERLGDRILAVYRAGLNRAE